jgi:hypothetical protein
MRRWHRLSAALAAVLALGLLTVGCGDNNGSGNNNGFQQGNPGTIIHSFGGFSATSLGEVQSETLTITNGGDGTLRIRNMELIESTDDQNREFGVEGWSPGEQNVSLEPGESAMFTITYEPQDTTPDTGVIEIRSNDPQNDPYRVNLQPPAPGAEIFATPSSVIYQSVPPASDPSWRGEPRMVQIQNVGEAPLRVQQIFIAESDVFRVTIPQPSQDEDGNTVYAPEDDLEGEGWPEVLQPGEEFPVRVWFKPNDRLPKEGKLVLKSNDPNSPRYEVPLSGNSGSACLNTNIDEVAFGQGSIGQTTQKTVTIENCSRSEDLEVSEIALSEDAGGVFQVVEDSLPGELNADPLTIAPREQENFVVTFSPTAQEDYSGTLVIKSNDPANNEKELPVTGSGTDNECPIAQASASLQGTAVPQTVINTVPLNTVEFDGTQSSDPDGNDDNLTYEWVIVSRPQGSTQSMLPNATVAEPRLFLDIAGTYEIELKVYDEEGAASCGDPAIVTINAVPDDEVHVQLVWDTPADPDQTDSIGTDLDLHYLHPQGLWDQEPWDVFWRNPNPDWGVSGDTTDDPSLDIDDTDGAGPENVNHSGLESLIYQTGVYYYSDRGMGASYATVRIYIRGVLELELENKYMPSTGSFWRVGFVEWPSATVQSTSRIYNGFPNN